MLSSATRPCSGRWASLTGEVKDITGAGVSGTLAELQLASTAESKFRTSADSKGGYRFFELPGGEYTLKLESPGFKSSTIKSIHLLEGEQKLLPTLQLEISVIGCGRRPTLDFVRLLASADQDGTLVGSVRIEQKKKPPSIAGVDVTLICGSASVCGSTKTDSKGEFIFRAAPPGYGNLSVRLSRKGFYPLDEPGYSVQEGFESIYWPLSLERCPLGNCDPKLRRKKPLGRCE